MPQAILSFPGGIMFQTDNICEYWPINGRQIISFTGDLWECAVLADNPIGVDGRSVNLSFHRVQNNPSLKSSEELNLWLLVHDFNFVIDEDFPDRMSYRDRLDLFVLDWIDSKSC
jgi:hypothetical protein